MNLPDIKKLIQSALEEDIKTGDITTLAIIPENLISKASVSIKADGIISGLEIMRNVFLQMDSSIVISLLKNDGDKVKAGDIAALIEGKTRSILTAERTALNFLQRMSGIASAAGELRKIVDGTKAKIIDTRKTAPGLRVLDKLAVKHGGCSNHRFGLFDMFLIKDNHIAAAGSISKAIKLCKKYRDEKQLNNKIEVEVKNLDELQEAINENPDIIMLDNFDVESIRIAVQLVNGKILLEASGGINKNNIRDYAETGIDFISIGALTHSVTALDISLEFYLDIGKVNV